VFAEGFRRGGSPRVWYQGDGFFTMVFFEILKYIHCFHQGVPSVPRCPISSKGSLFLFNQHEGMWSVAWVNRRNNMVAPLTVSAPCLRISTMMTRGTRVLGPCSPSSPSHSTSQHLMSLGARSRFWRVSNEFGHENPTASAMLCLAWVEAVFRDWPIDRAAHPGKRHRQTLAHVNEPLLHAAPSVHRHSGAANAPKLNPLCYRHQGGPAAHGARDTALVVDLYGAFDHGRQVGWVTGRLVAQLGGDLVGENIYCFHQGVLTVPRCPISSKGSSQRVFVF
jgi:hypothetical protein